MIIMEEKDEIRQALIDRWHQFERDICNMYNSGPNEKDKIIELLINYIIPLDNGKLGLIPNFVDYQIVKYAKLLEIKGKKEVDLFMNKSLLDQIEYIKINKSNFNTINPDIVTSIDADFEKLKSSIKNYKLTISKIFETSWVKENSRFINIFIEHTLMMNDIMKNSACQRNMSLLFLYYYLSLVEGPIRSNIDMLIDLIIRRDGIFKFYESKETINDSNKLFSKYYSLSQKITSLDKIYNFSCFSKYISIKLRNNIAHSLFKIENGGLIILDDGTKVDDIFEKCKELQDFLGYYLDALIRFISDEWKPGVDEILENICKEVLEGKSPFESYLSSMFDNIDNK